MEVAASWLGLHFRGVVLEFRFEWTSFKHDSSGDLHDPILR